MREIFSFRKELNTKKIIIAILVPLIIIGFFIRNKAISFKFKHI